MSDNYMIIKTKKLSPREVKKKLHDFIDSISEDCGPEVDQMADELKAHGDMFIDTLSGNGGGANFRNGGGMMYRNGRAWHRNDGTWEQREEQRKRNEQKLQEIDRQLQEIKQQMND